MINLPASSWLAPAGTGDSLLPNVFGSGSSWISLGYKELMLLGSYMASILLP